MAKTILKMCGPDYFVAKAIECLEIFSSTKQMPDRVISAAKYKSKLLFSEFGDVFQFKGIIEAAEEKHEGQPDDINRLYLDTLSSFIEHVSKIPKS